MRQVWLVGFFILTSCGPPTVGATCSETDTVTCKSSTEVYACIGGTWSIAPCQGPRGCTDVSVLDCDLSFATAGATCPPWAEGRQACQSTPAALTSCVNGVWNKVSTCDACSVASGAPQCTGGTGGGGGTGGCGTCDGCCSNGQCIAAPNNGTTNFCGTGGAACDDCGARGQRCDSSSLSCVAAASCNPTTCPTGCCSNGQCFTTPLNATANFCGKGGAACADCGRIGLVCNPNSFSCDVAGGTGGGAGGGGGTTTDPCSGVPVGGQCLTTSIVRFCSIPTGAGNASVQTYQCPGGSSCQATGAGAACVQTGSCVQGDSRCTNATTLQQCTAQGTWGAAQMCGGAGCIGSPVGASCAAQVPTTTITGTLKYETRSPRSDLTDWGPPTAVPARNVMVISQHGNNWLDATTTDANGQFSLKVPSTATTIDSVLFAAFGGNGLGIRFAVGDPGLGTGTFSPGQQGMNARYWSWSKAVSSLTSGAVTTITTAQGSGALNIYDLLQSIWLSSVANNQGQEGQTIAMWMGIGTEWSCGACFSDSGNGLATGIWMPGGPQDEGYWSDYTIAHELGHWQMRSYGTSPNEGGSHYIMCPTFPGQAWSEGYATWHSAAVRNTSFLEDKQQGSFFWFDIGSRTYFPQSSQPSPISGPGGSSLLSELDENSVSAMLWTISNSRATGTKEIFNAIASDHMNTTPWPRGYTRRTWDVGNNCAKTNVVNTNQPSMHAADMLDALSCGGSPAQSNRVPLATINAAISNGSYYPYPAASPVCRNGVCYGCKSGSTCSAGNVASACGTGGVACVQCSSGQSCVNGVCQ